MRWSSVICLLLISTALAKPRPKRTLDYFKSLISSKLFGENKVVVAQPINQNNENYQLYKIPGLDDILIKVSRKKENEPNKEDKPAKPADPIIVKPEVAIIGSYLGTTTEKETLLAIEMVKSLLKSGILSGGQDTVPELMLPMVQPHLEYAEEQHVPVQPLQVFSKQGNVFVPMRGVQHNLFPIYPEYPPLFISPEPTHPTTQSKYSYKQKGPDADMLYESYNNKDVIVTRTEKEPPLPEFLRLRISEVATIGANPYVARQPIRINDPPVAYQYNGQHNNVPAESTQDLFPFLSHRIAKPQRNGNQPEYIGNNMYGAPIKMERNPVLISESLPYDAVVNPYYFGANVQQIVRCKEKSESKVCPYDKVQKTKSNAPQIELKPQQQFVDVKQNEAIKNNKANTNDNRIAVNEFLKNHSVNGQLVSQYMYKQMNHHSNENYTEVKVGGPQITEVVEASKNLDKDFVFIPPKIDEPLHSALSLSNVEKNNNDNNAFTSKMKSNERKHTHFVPSVPRIKSNEKSKKNSFIRNPIVVFDANDAEEHTNSVNVKTNKAVTGTIDEESKRGDIPGSSF